MPVTPSSRMTPVRLEQPEKALLPTYVMALGIVISLKPVQLQNAKSAILVTPSGMIQTEASGSNPVSSKVIGSSFSNFQIR